MSAAADLGAAPLRRPSPVRRSRCRGASLIEVAVATLVLGLFSIETVEFFARARFWFDQEEHKRVATLLAQEALEKTGVPYADLIPRIELRSIASIQYSVVVTIQGGAPEFGVNTVRCVVTWWALPGVSRTVSLASLVYDR
jgi:hypothetical protein